MSRVLVTGGTGYVAGWCIVELLRRGYSVRTTVRDRSRAGELHTAVAGVVDPGDRLEFAEADLLSADGWGAAVDGIDQVLHVASPMGGTEDLVTPAREGVRNVLRASATAGVKRVVMTSAANAASPSSYTAEGVYDETTWTNPDDPALIPYRRSKAVAERTAWDLAATDAAAVELVTILPGAVLGPVLSTSTIGSVGIVARMLSGAMRGVPRIGLEVVDVRDLAVLHVRALESSVAAGERFLGTGEFVWMVDIARTLRAGLGPDAARVSTRRLPNVAVRLAARRDANLRSIAPALGRRAVHTTAKAERLLGWRPRPAGETVLDCARSLIAVGAV
jgi:dihydroflavonol-4-reductase